MENPIEKVHELLHRPRSSADFSPAARYAVSRLCDYAAQEHEQREKAETLFCNERRKALAFSAEMARQERTIDDLRQQLSFLRETLREAGGVSNDDKHRAGGCPAQDRAGDRQLVCLGCGHEHNCDIHGCAPAARGGGAHQAHGRAAAERAARKSATVWKLSDREKAIVQELGKTKEVIK